MSSASFRRAIITAVVALFVSQTCAWTVKSRELVDVELSEDGTLTILLSAPATASPGLYQWKSGVAEPAKICSINAPSFFSFNRRIVIERIRSEHDTLRLYDARNCAVLAQIQTAGRVIDADARGALVAFAIQYPDQEPALELYTKRGKPIARAAVGRNVELAFAPDGKTLLNFDLSDATNTSANALWKLPSLTRLKPPLWMNKDEVTFVPGSAFVNLYSEGGLSIVSWSTGKPKYTTPMARTVRVRYLSGDGRYGVIHERLAQTDSVDWIDFATGTRVPLGNGSIDHAAISATGTRVAWTQRGGALSDEVTVFRAAVTSAGTVTPEN